MKRARQKETPLRGGQTQSWGRWIGWDALIVSLAAREQYVYLMDHNKLSLARRQNKDVRYRTRHGEIADHGACTGRLEDSTFSPPLPKDLKSARGSCQVAGADGTPDRQIDCPVPYRLRSVYLTNYFLLGRQT